MSESTDRQAVDNEAIANAACRPEEAQSGGGAGSNHPSWRSKLAMTALGAAVAGITRAIFDWALNEFHP
jgi:hypothetical protein